MSCALVGTSESSLRRAGWAGAGASRGAVSGRAARGGSADARGDGVEAEAGLPGDPILEHEGAADGRGDAGEDALEVGGAEGFGETGDLVPYHPTLPAACVESHRLLNPIKSSPE